MALVGIELETLVSEPDVLTTRPSPCAKVLKTEAHYSNRLTSEAKWAISIICTTLFKFMLIYFFRILLRRRRSASCGRSGTYVVGKDPVR